MALSAYVDEFSRQPWRSLILISCAGTACLSFIDLHHQSFMAGWGVMLLAMMPLLLAQPVTHVLRSSRRQTRVRALLAFGLGYALVWMLAGPILAVMAVMFRALVGDDIVALLAAISLATIWSASPWHQSAHNRCHRVPRLAVFGRKADRDAHSYGIVHGGWCFASCWAWMFVPLAASHHHIGVMVLVTFVMFIERLDAHGTPRWRFPLPFRAFFRRYAHA